MTAAEPVSLSMSGFSSTGRGGDYNFTINVDFTGLFVHFIYLHVCIMHKPAFICHEDNEVG